MSKLTVSAFAKKHKVSRMTVLRRIREGELPATKSVIEPATARRPERFEWLIESGAKFTKLQAGRPPKALEIEQVLTGSDRAPVPRKPAKPRPAPLSGAQPSNVISLFARRAVR